MYHPQTNILSQILYHRLVDNIAQILHAFPSLFVSSLREFPENCVYKHCGLSWFIEYLHRKLLTANFLSYAIESAKKKFVYWICIL